MMGLIIPLIVKMRNLLLFAFNIILQYGSMKKRDGFEMTHCLISSLYRA